MSSSRSCPPSSSTKSSSQPQCIPCALVGPSSTLRKRLIICCDGTFCAADSGQLNNPTNIARLSRCIANVGVDENGKLIPQMVFYQSGVATGKLSFMTKGMQGGFGEGLTEKVCEAYTFIVNNYGPGDEIFIFGFSRGAYTARCLANFICQIGILSPGMMDYFHQIFTAYKTRDRRTERTFAEMVWAHQRVRPGELGFDTQRTDPPTRYDWIRTWAHLHSTVKVVGVFDTVGSLGMSGWVAQPGESKGAGASKYYCAKLNPKIEHAFQALALDEHRGNFAPTLFYLDEACQKAGVKLRQCWFPGYHSCVGGESNYGSDTNSVDEITFSWMIDQLTRENLLQINARALQYPILGRLDSDIINDSRASKPRNPQEANERRIDWSDGRLQETQTVFYGIASEIATQRWEYIRKPGEYRAHDEETGERVETSAFKESIHPCVWHRVQNRTYEPLALPLRDWDRVRRRDGRGFEWVKYERGSGGRVVVSLPEYKIPAIEEREKEVEMEFWSGCLEQKIAPGEDLRRLDLGNGISRGRKKRPVVAERVDSGYGGSQDDVEFLTVETLQIGGGRASSRTGLERSPSGRDRSSSGVDRPEIRSERSPIRQQ